MRIIKLVEKTNGKFDLSVEGGELDLASIAVILTATAHAVSVQIKEALMGAKVASAIMKEADRESAK